MIKPLAALLLSASLVSALPASSDAQTSPPRPRGAVQAPMTPAVTLTPEGGYREGSATARVRLVEYVSYTCGHCADLAAQSHQTLSVNYVRPGTASVEVRPMVRDIVDLTSAVLARCGAPARFFDRHNALMARQAETMAAAQLSAPSWGAAPPEQRLPRIAADTGLITALRATGLTPAAASACLGDRAQIDRIIAISQAGSQLGVTGTPSFLLNGALLSNVHDWASLRPRLDAALAAR